MDQRNFQSSNFIKPLKVVHTAMTIGCLFFMIIAIFLNSFENGLAVYGKSFSLILTYFSFFSLALIPLAYFLFKKNVGKISATLSLPDKLFLYRKYYIIKLAMFEGTFFFCNVCYLLVNAKYILFIALMALIVLFMNYPNRTTISDDLNLNDEDFNQI